MPEQSSIRHLVKDLKKQIFELEKNNYDKLYIYRTSKDWWRMGGNSALFYHYEIALQLNLNSTLRFDNDYYYTWQTGIISIRQPELILDKIRQAKFPYQCKHNYLIIIQLPHKFTKDDINRFSQAEQAKLDQINKLLMPTHVMPQINTHLDQLSERIINKAIQLPRQRYDLYGEPCARICLQLQEDFVSVSSGQINLSDYLSDSLYHLDILANHLIVAKKYNFLDNNAMLECARHIDFLRSHLPKEVKKLQKRQLTNPPKEKPHA